MQRTELVLFSAYHKAYIRPKVDWVIPIHAGKSISKEELNITGDDIGDQISELNPIFCELTALYWLWKNFDRDQFDYWGLMHYRRYLLPDNLLHRIGKRKKFQFPNEQSIMDKHIDASLRCRIVKDLKKYDVIVARRIKTRDDLKRPISIEAAYKQDHLAGDWDCMIRVLLDKYPEYQRSLDFFAAYSFSVGNMMITSWTVWDKYLTWLFDILFEVYRQIKISEDIYQRRVIGFLSERLLNLYIYHNNLRPKEYLVANFG